MENITNFPYKINDYTFISDIKSVSETFLKHNNISHIVLIDKYLELEEDINTSEFQIMSLEIENPKPEDNFLFGLSSISRFVSDHICIFISESGDSPILPTLIISYLISKNNTLDEIKKQIPNDIYKNIYEEYITRLEEYDKYINNKTPIYFFKCGKCRKNLFTDKELMLFHDISAKNKYSNKRRKNNTVKTNECTSYFLDLDRLVKDEEGKNNVKIEEICGNENIEICIGAIKCKKCSNKLGEFFPKGTQCSCGSWVVPAIQIIKSKVDKVKNEKYK